MEYKIKRHLIPLIVCPGDRVRVTFMTPFAPSYAGRYTVEGIIWSEHQSGFKLGNDFVTDYDDKTRLENVSSTLVSLTILEPHAITGMSIITEEQRAKITAT